MPTYEYRCDSCDEKFDVVQGFHDEPVTACPTCGSPVRKVFGNVGIVFKGSGFYKNDSRNGARSTSRDGDSAAPEAPAGGTSSSEAASSDTSSGPSGNGSTGKGPDSSGSKKTSSSPDATPAAAPAGKKSTTTKEAPASA